MSFAFLSAEFCDPFCPKMVSLLTHSKFNPFLNFLLLVPFTIYKSLKENITFFIGLFPTMPPWLLGYLESFDIKFHLFCMGKLNNLSMPSNVLSLLVP